MEIKTEQKQKDYLKTLHFNIKDFYATSLKYSKYKDNEFKAFLNNNEEEILNFLENLNQDIFNSIINEYKNYQRIENLNFKKKMDIRQLKTFINDFVYNHNKEFIKSLNQLDKTPKINQTILNIINKKLCFNENKLRNFTIKFYLMFYDVINEEMKTALNEIVEHQTGEF